MTPLPHDHPASRLAQTVEELGKRIDAGSPDWRLALGDAVHLAKSVRGLVASNDDPGPDAPPPANVVQMKGARLMGVLDLCQRETVEVTRLNTRRGAASSVKGYRYGLLAAHRSVNGERGWTITHLPTGLSMANRTGVFSNAENAVAAMVEITALTNDWLHLDTDDLKRLSEPVKAIGARHGGDLERVAVGRQGDITRRANQNLCERFA